MAGAKRGPKPQPPQEEAAKTIYTYGCPEEGRDQFFYDRYAFAYRIPIDYGAPRRIELFKRISSRINPSYFEWHSWTERMIEAACENQFIGLAGCSSSGKTHNLTGFACTWWLCAPAISSVIYCSTTAKALRKRGWANVQMFHTSIPGPRIGNFVDSRMMWQAVKGDDKHAIVGIAVEEGETNKVSDNIKGVHTKRQMVIIDEATAVPHAIFEACTNLYSYPREFILIMIGNPRSRLDEFGKFIEPLGGWNSVTVNTEEWETKPQMNGVTGICVRFDAEKSPNILEGRIVSKHLPTKERVEMRRSSLNSENDPSYWSNERGFPPPEGLNKNVISESVLEKFNAYGKHEFTGQNFRIIGVLDPARTGDRIVVRFGKLGWITHDKMALQAGPPIPISVNANSKNPIDFQITEQVERECAKITCFGNNYFGGAYSCSAEDFGVDSTGGGADLVDIMQRNWDLNVNRILFSASPSQEPCSHEDKRPADEVYNNKRTEMYFRTANAVKSGQLKGVDKETATELVSIEFDDSKAKLALMKKEDYKEKFGKSPDYADTLVMLVEMARKKGLALAAVGNTAVAVEQNSQQFSKNQEVYGNVDYAPEEEPQEENDVMDYEPI